jgi:hypothetical protein
MADSEKRTDPDNDLDAHDGWELELMLAGQKPLTMFYELVPMDAGLVPDEKFAPHVAAGRIVMREVFEPAIGLPAEAKDARLRRVLYALPGEAWRIDAMLMLCRVYQQQGGWDAGLERLTGKLLGYDDEQIETWLRNVGLSEK